MSQVTEWLCAGGGMESRPRVARKRAVWWLLLAAGVLRAGAAELARPEIPATAVQPAYDVVVAGAGTGGLGAAIQAARLGAAVLLLEETDWIGGQMLAAAVTAIDEGGAGNLVRDRGLYRELLQRVEAHYRPLGLDPLGAGRYRNMRFEPRVGRQLMLGFLKEAGLRGRLDLALRARVIRVHRTDRTVTGVEVEFASESGPVTRRVTSRVLIDATEWGDVLPLAGVRYRSGNHTNESLDLSRLIQENTWTAVVRRYPAGVPPELRLPTAPPGYAAIRARFAERIVPGTAEFRRGQPMSWQSFIEYRGMPDSGDSGRPGEVTRTHLNFSNDYPCSVAYLEDPAKRRATDRAMRLRTLQLLYFLQRDLGMADWSVANDEGFDSPYNREQIDAWLRDEPELAPFRRVLYHFSVLPYVRESRRLVGGHTLVAREISRGPGRRPVPFPTTIALGDYRLDLHGGRAAADLELDLDRIEDLEDAVPGRAGPFAIPLECLVPVEIDGFLAAEKNYSQSRLVNGASRMQPHTLHVGQAAGALAALAVRHQVAPRAIDPLLVQRVLLAAGSTLLLTPLQDVSSSAPDWPALQLAGVRGWLAPEEGRFFPDRALTAAEMAGIRTALGDREARKANEPVTRADLARALTSGGGGEVRVAFRATPAEAALAPTRSEAAQVLAEFFELRALARLKGEVRELAWQSVRPASSPAAVETPETSLLRRLQAVGILTEIDYWAAQTRPDQECDGARVAALLRQAAHVLDPAATPDRAVEVLLRAQVITSRDYWTKNAVPGGRCAGRNVAALLRNLSRHPAILRRPPP